MLWCSSPTVLTHDQIYYWLQNYVFLSFNRPTLFTKTLYLSLRFKADQLLPVEKTYFRNQLRSVWICSNICTILTFVSVSVGTFPNFSILNEEKHIRQVSCRCDGWTCASPVVSSHQPSCSDVSSPRRRLLSSWFTSLIKPVCACVCARVVRGHTVSHNRSTSPPLAASPSVGGCQ